MGGGAQDVDAAIDHALLASLQAASALEQQPTDEAANANTNVFEQDSQNRYERQSRCMVRLLRHETDVKQHMVDGWLLEELARH